MIIQVDKLTRTYKSKVTTNPFRDIFFPTYRNTSAVDEVSFRINKGETVALLGPNGAGKTTMMKMLSGLIYPTSGSVTVLGYKPYERKREFLLKIGLVMGNKTGLDWDLTPTQSFQFIKKIYGIGDHEFTSRIDTLTTMLDAQGYLDVQVRKLSLGERMKMEVIGAILHDPEILFLDEPTIGLDIISKQKIRSFLREIQQSMGVTLLLTSHDMDDVEKICDRVMVISNGKKVYDDSLQKLTEHYTTDRYVKLIFATMPDKNEIKKLGSVIETGENFVIMKTSKIVLPQIIEKAFTDFPVIDIDVLSVPLEEIIADIYHKTS